MNWTMEQIEKLIQELRKRPVIWDKSKAQYKDKNKKKEAFNRIGRIMKIDPNEVEKKIYNIRKQFQRECLKMSRSRSKSKWFAFDNLRFLDNKHRDTITHIAGENRLLGISNEDSNNMLETISPDLCNVVYDTQSVSNRDSDGVSEYDTKFGLWNNDEQNAYNNSSGIDEYRTRKSSLPNDEFIPFSELVAIKIRNLNDPCLRTETQEKILKIIFEAEKSQYTTLVRESSTPISYDKGNFQSGQCSPDSRMFYCTEKGIQGMPIKAELSFDADSQDEV